MPISSDNWTGGNSKTLFTTSYGDQQVSDFGRFNVVIKNNDGYNSSVKSLTFTADPTGINFDDAASVLKNNAEGFFAASHIYIQDPNNTGVAPSGFAANGVQTVNTPLPPAYWLMGTGLIGVGLLGWRRKKA